MEDSELQELTEELSQQFFDTTFQHCAYFNRRLRTTGGRYLLTSHDIEVNPKQFERYGKEAVVDILKHELCHYHLHLSGKGYRHKDSDFKQLSQQVGAPRYCTPLQSYQERVNYTYQCKRCKATFGRIRKVNTRKMVCGYCNGSLRMVENHRHKPM